MLYLMFNFGLYLMLSLVLYLMLNFGLYLMLSLVLFDVEFLCFI